MNTVMVIARNTISEALRKKILNAFLMVGVVLIAFTFIFQQFAPRQELTLVKGMGLGIISLAGLFDSSTPAHPQVRSLFLGCRCT